MEITSDLPHVIENRIGPHRVSDNSDGNVKGKSVVKSFCQRHFVLPFVLISKCILIHLKLLSEVRRSRNIKMNETTYCSLVYVQTSL